ncbi:MAG: LapA family protein [Hydrogenophaga sp.]|uniref:LapA family protein n=1 Tax=Hydrogenophaga sp. TaxID=1904254 RepID=UPI001D312D27|nr:LapA family protein [Hydrogenophaga sp.]MBX3610534.1 LapA family protein [Hydrogenophaga sp.]
MQLRSMSIVVVWVLLALFTLLNLSAFLEPTTLSLGVTEIQAPLGLILLGTVALVSALFMVVIVMQQASTLMDTRRTAKELAAQRELADKAEASRFVELRQAIDALSDRMAIAQASAREAIDAQAASNQQALTERFDETVQSLSANLGEIEDKLDRVLSVPRLPPTD